MSDNNVLLLRTHYVDDEIVRFAERLRRDCPYEFALLLDETRGEIDARGLPKISINHAALDGLGLYRNFEKVGWRCGDYGMHIALSERPGRPYYWMVEHDVRFSSLDPGEFFRFFEGVEPADLLCVNLKVADPDWWWRQSMSAHAQTVYRCHFPIIRLSLAALTHLASQRARMSSAWTAPRGWLARLRLPVWPNDEAFVATECMSAGYSCRDFNSFGRTFYTPKSFAFWDAVAQSDFEARPPDGLLYHPVLYGEHYFRKLRELTLDGGKDARRVATEIRALAGREWSAAEAERYATEIERRGTPPRYWWERVRRALARRGIGR